MPMMASSKRDWEPLRLVVRYLRKHRSGLAWALLWRLAYVLLPMQVPVLAGALADALAGNTATLYGWQAPPGTASTVLMVIALGLVVIAILSALAAHLRLVATATLSRRFVTHLRKAVIDKIATMPPLQQQAYGAGELLDRAVSDAGSMRRFLDRVFIQAITNVARVVYPVAILFTLDARLALIALSVIPPQWLLMRHLHGRLYAATQRARTARAALTSRLKEQLDGTESMQALHAEAAAAQRTQAHAERLEARQLDSSILSASISGITWATTGLGLALTWWLGGSAVLGGTLTLGTLITFTGFVEFAYRPFRQFSRIAGTFQKGLVSLRRIHNLLMAPSTLPEPPHAPPLRLTNGHIAFDKVTVCYDGEPVISDLNLTIVPRTLTVITGPSGCGKSTVLRLITRFLDPVDGTVKIDGQRLDQLQIASIRSQVALVPQQPVGFEGSVLDNLRLGQPDATLDHVIEACRDADALDFIEALDGGFQATLAEGGAGLSGGQLRRLALARALLHNPRILLLDEPTAGLDPQAEAAVAETLHRLARNRTVVVVTHRGHLIGKADRIVRLGPEVRREQHPPIKPSAPHRHEHLATPTT